MSVLDEARLWLTRPLTSASVLALTINPNLDVRAVVGVRNSVRKNLQAVVKPVLIALALVAGGHVYLRSGRVPGVPLHPFSVSTAVLTILSEQKKGYADLIGQQLTVADVNGTETFASRLHFPGVDSCVVNKYSEGTSEFVCSKKGGDTSFSAFHNVFPVLAKLGGWSQLSADWEAAQYVTKYSSIDGAEIVVSQTASGDSTIVFGRWKV